MRNTWISLLLALLLCCAPVCGALAEAGEVVDAAPGEAMPDELSGNTSLVMVENEATPAPTATAAPAETDGGEAGTGEKSASQTAAPAEEAKLTLSASKLTVGVKEVCKALTATVTPEGSGQTVTWTSGNAKVAKVNKKTGAITGVKAGTAVITARTSGGLKQTCKVTVKKAPGKVTLNKTAVRLSVGALETLKATLPSGTASALTWKTKNKGVAAVDAAGKITAVASGSTTIVVKTFNGKKATCKVTVVDDPDQVFLPATFSIVRHEHKVITPSVVDARGEMSLATYTFTAEKGTGAVSIDPATGEMVGEAVGTAFVRVSTHNGVSTHLDEKGERVETVCTVTVAEGPEAVSLAAESVTIGVGQSYSLKPVILGADGQKLSGAKYTVASSNAKGVSVSAKGAIKGLKKGNYVVTVTAFNGVQGSCRVKVLNAPTSVTVTPRKPVIGLGQTAALKVSYPAGTMGSCTFSSSNKKVATVDSQGNITGKGKGTAIITVRTHNSKTAKVTVKVGDGPRFITLNGEYTLVYDATTDDYRVVYKLAMDPGDTFQITYDNEYNTYGSITGYASDDTGVASVSDFGLVTAHGPGKANIVVRSSSGAEATLAVAVSGSLPARIAFDASGATVEAGRSAAAPALRGENITAEALSGAIYESSDNGVFTVAWSDEEARWLLYGVNPGTALLNASAGGAFAEVRVTVTEAAPVSGGIRFEEDTVYMQVGETCAPVVRDADGNPVEALLASGDPAVVSVDEAGVLTAMAEGTATITATAGESTAAMTVLVWTGETRLTLDTESMILGEGQRRRLKASVNGTETTAKLTFASSNPSAATVSAAGLVIARAVGSAVITVTEPGGAVAACSVLVQPAPSRIVLEPAAITERLEAGGAQIKWTFGAPDEVGDVSFRSADTGIATVDASGLVTFVAVGATTVTAVTNNGLTATIPVTVLPNRKTTDEVTYRLFAAYSYPDSLPFTQRNAKGMQTVFSKSAIGGLTYKTKVLGGPQKTQLLSGIANYFANTDDNDVSVVYLCSHGHNDSGIYRNYRLSLTGYNKKPNDPNYYLTAGEIFNCVSRIRGDVVLILDSCYSGTFIEDMKGSLDTLDGRIAVLTAASNTRATYYNVKKNAVDFFTFFLLQGLGYNERESWWYADGKGAKGVYPGYLAADITGNKDGIVTLGEMYTYASRCIAANIPNYMKMSWYWGDTKRVQAPRLYAGKLKNLALYQPKR